MPPINTILFNVSFSAKLKQLVCLFCLVWLGVSSTVSAATYQHTSKNFSLFEGLNLIPATQRAAKATEIYKSNFRDVSEFAAMAVLDSLTTMAQSLDDLQLESAVYLMRADYYSVNRGFNNSSINYHQQAIDFAVAHEMPVEAAQYLHKKGLYYFTFNHNTDACHYFLQAYDQFKQIGFKNIPDISRYLAEQAQFYYTLHDYEAAKPLLKQALLYPINGERIRINLTTTMGLIHRNLKQYTEALVYFNKALNLANASKDSAWVAISTGNIGSVYFLQGRYEKARPYLLSDYQTSIKYKQYNNAATTLLRLSHINIQYRQYQQAQARVDSAEILIKDSKEDVLGTLIEIYRQAAIIAEQTGRLKDAILYSKHYEAARDSFARRDNVAAVERVKLTFENEKYKAEIEQLQTRSSVRIFKRNAVICILFLLMVIFILVFNRYRLNAIRDQELLMIKKRRVDEKLKSAAESLLLYTENLKQNNALIEKFKGEIERFKIQSTDRAGTEKLEKLMQAHIMTDETWDEFKKLFTDVHSGFFLKLRQNFPYLTDTDVRMLSLIKLGLNNREMSNMLGITIEGIKKSKQRLRKKMQITGDRDIEQIIAEI